MFAFFLFLMSILEKAHLAAIEEARLIAKVETDGNKKIKKKRNRPPAITPSIPIKAPPITIREPIIEESILETSISKEEEDRVSKKS